VDKSFGPLPSLALALPLPLPSAASAAKPNSGLVAAAPASASNFVVFTGVRDKVLEGKLASLGWAMEDSVTKKTTALVIADEGAKETGKMKKARDQGIKILTLSEFRKTLL
jgi:NAD-dependent DNA ligase